MNDIYYTDSEKAEAIATTFAATHNTAHNTAYPLDEQITRKVKET